MGDRTRLVIPLKPQERDDKTRLVIPEPRENKEHYAPHATRVRWERGTIPQGGVYPGMVGCTIPQRGVYPGYILLHTLGGVYPGYSLLYTQGGV